MSDLTVRRLVCDDCGAELITNTSYPANYALELRAINVNHNTTGLVYGVATLPPIDGTKHFCDKECLNSAIQKGLI